MGGPGRYTVGQVDGSLLNLVGETIEGIGELVLASSLPACRFKYEDEETQLCPLAVPQDQWLRLKQPLLHPAKARKSSLTRVREYGLF